MKVPRLSEFTGQPLRKYLEALEAWALGSETIPEGPGMRAEQTGRGLVLEFAGFGIALIKTTSAVSGRSGTTPGTGTAQVQRYNGVSLAGNRTITVRNVSGSAASTDKYGFAFKLGGFWWLGPVECG